MNLILTNVISFKKISPAFSVKLDIARGLAASMVMIAHFRVHFFESYDNLSDHYHNVINYCLFFITRFGHESVMVFFVLSGYLVGGTFLKEYLQGNPDWLKYLVNRFARMWTVLIPALIAGAIIDYITLKINPSTPGAEDFNIKNFFGNFFFLQNIRTSTFGTNAPLWSLANEFWYYILWPVILIITGLRLKLIFKLFILSAFGVVCYHIAPDVIALFPVWISGATICFVKDNKLFRYRAFIILNYVFLIAAILFSSLQRNLTGYYILGLAVFLLILQWQYAREFNFNFFISKISHFFSEFSFSLYAVHYFFMYLLFNIAQYYFKIPILLKDAGINNWIILLVLIAVTYLWAYSFYFLTERHTHKLRKTIHHKLIKLKA